MMVLLTFLLIWTLCTRKEIVRSGHASNNSVIAQKMWIVVRFQTVIWNRNRNVNNNHVLAQFKWSRYQRLFIWQFYQFLTRQDNSLHTPICISTQHDCVTASCNLLSHSDKESNGPPMQSGCWGSDWRQNEQAYSRRNYTQNLTQYCIGALCFALVTYGIDYLHSSAYDWLITHISLL
jgi:hypothetical protein